MRVGPQNPGAWAGRQRCGCAWAQLGAGVVATACADHQGALMAAVTSNLPCPDLGRDNMADPAPRQRPRAMNFREASAPTRLRRASWPADWYLYRQVHWYEGTTWKAHGDGIEQALNMTLGVWLDKDMPGDDWEIVPKR